MPERSAGVGVTLMAAAMASSMALPDASRGVGPGHDRRSEGDPRYVARPNPGRKPRSENRRLTESIPVRFTKTDRVELQREADRLGMSVPELLRHTWYIARAAS